LQASLVPFARSHGDPAGQIAITMVVNDNGDGGRVTVECNYDNNRHGVDVGKCDIPK
jgi:hypothetical protein